MTEHTGGRLHVRGEKRTIEIISEGPLPYVRIAHIGSNSPGDQANARRLVAAWNACEGLTTEDLESGRWQMTLMDIDDSPVGP